MNKSHKSFKADRRKAMLNNKYKNNEVNGNSIDYKPKKEMVPKYTKKRNQSNGQTQVNQKPTYRLASEQEREYHLAQLKAENSLEQIAEMNINVQEIVAAPEPQKIQIQDSFQLDENLLDMNPIKRVIYQSLLNQ